MSSLLVYVPLWRLVGYEPMYFKDPRKTLVTLRTKFGNRFYTVLPGGKEVYFISEPDDMGELLGGLTKNFGRKEFEELIRDTLLTLNGKSHFPRRKALQPFFPKWMPILDEARIVAIMREAGNGGGFSRKLAARLSAEAAADMTRLISSESTFGLEFSRNLREKFQELVQAGGSPRQVVYGIPPLTPNWWRLRRAKAAFKHDVAACVQARKASEVLGGPDFISFCLRQSGLSDKQIAVESEGMVIAGADTTGTAAAALVAYFKEHPEELALVREETDRLGVRNLPISQSWKLLTERIRILEKVLQDCPPIFALGRKVLTEPVELKAGYNLLPESLVVLPIVNLPGEGKDGPAGRFLFGHGARMCIGSNAAYLTLLIFMGLLADNPEWLE